MQPDRYHDLEVINIKNVQMKMGEINRSELVEYFLKIGGETEDEETFKGPHWEVTVGPQILTRFGALNIRHVLISIKAEDNAFDDFMERFNLNFLRCGG
ncbi:MAG: hypothetical protein AAGU76_06140 [Sedimentibacter sp.]|uniref:hypothetical protein n=1 Tax=Sedimentibacter sp. TaxID=1960295 RepID=UPI0031594730